MNRFIAITSLIILSNLTIFAQEVNLKNGLVAYYPFNGNTLDASGNGNNGKVNGAVLTTDYNGKNNSAYYFNGNAYIVVPNNNSLNINSTFSIFAWVNFEDADQNQKILSKIVPFKYESGYILGVDKGKIYPEVFDDLNYKAGGTNGPTIQSNTWYLVGITIDKNKLKYYCNGKSIFEVASNLGNLGNNFEDLVIGTNSWEKPPKNLMVRGKIDEIRLYKRVLNDAEILALYNLQAKESILAPSITWQNPTNTEINTNQEYFNIKACIKTKKQLTGLQIFVNNVLFTDLSDRGYNVVPSGGCDILVEQQLLLFEGINEVKIVAINDGGTTVSETRNLIYQHAEQDVTAPVITLIEPNVQRGFKMIEQTGQINIKGKATDESGILKVTVNGVNANLYSGGMFQSNIILGVGDNPVTISATDNKQNTSEFSFFVQRKSNPVIVQNDINVNEKRIALVIGNADYASAPLRNPVNDAKVISEELKKIGFEVTTVINGSQTEMKKAISDYGTILGNDKNSVGLFYYAGHGIQARGKNYIIPTDAKIEKEADVEVYCVDLDNLLGNLEYAGNNLNVIILDACRNNPFGRGFRSQAGTGLATVNAPSGTIIAFATAPGSTAADGSGNNGLYTQEFVKALQIPNIKIEDVFKTVRKQVKAISNGAQIPWENSALEGDFYFRKQ